MGTRTHSSQATRDQNTTHRDSHLLRARPVVCTVLAGLFFTLVDVSVRADELSVIKTIETFEGNAPTAAKGARPEAISFWRWSKEDKEKAKEFSHLETGNVPGETGKAFKVTIFKPLPRGLDFYTLWLTELNYLPPGARAIRLRARVVSGQFTLTVGSPTVYF